VGYTSHLDVQDLCLMWAVLSEEEHKLWMERAVDLRHSSAGLDMSMDFMVVSPFPPPDIAAASVSFPSLASCFKASNTAGGLSKLMLRYNTLCQQELPDVPDDKVPLEPMGRGRSCTRRDASAEMLPLGAPALTPPVCTALDQMDGLSLAVLSQALCKDLDKMDAAAMDLAPSPRLRHFILSTRFLWSP